MAAILKKFDGVVYSIRGDHVEVLEGIIIITDAYSRCTTFHSYDNKIHKYDLSEEQGVVKNGILWLYLRDDDVARKLLIDHEELQILKLAKRIDECKNIVKKIKREL